MQLNDITDPEWYKKFEQIERDDDLEVLKIMDMNDMLQSQIHCGRLSWEDLSSINGLVFETAKGLCLPETQIQPASVDVTLSNVFYKEDKPVTNSSKFVQVAQKESPKMTRHEVSQITLKPGEFILASTNEYFRIPNFMVAEYRLNSSLGRVGLNHALAAFIDPGFFGTVTLELHNNSKHHNLILEAGMKIGQVIFETCAPVPQGKCYMSRGQYNGQVATQPNKGLRTNES